jgi:hypothetical protein
MNTIASFCTNCGIENKNKNEYCTNCGKQLSTNNTKKERAKPLEVNQQQLLEIGSQLKFKLDNVAPEDQQLEQDENVVALIVEGKQTVKFLHQQKDDVNDINFHSTLLELNSKLNALENEYQKEIVKYQRQKKELMDSIESVQTFFKTLEFLRKIDLNYLKDNKDEFDLIEENIKDVRTHIRNFDEDLDQIEKYLKHYSNPFINNTKGLSKEIQIQLEEIPTFKVLNLKNRLIQLDPKEVSPMISRVNTLIKDLKKASTIKTKLENKEVEYIFNNLKSDLKELHRDVRQELKKDVNDIIYYFENPLNRFKGSPNPTNLKKLKSIFEHNYSEELIENFKEEYHDAKRNYRLKSSIIFSIVALLANLILFFVVEAQTVQIFLTNTVILFFYVPATFFPHPSSDNMGETKNLIVEKNKHFENELEELKNNSA